MRATDELEHYMTACSRLKAENARLQARVDNQEPWLVALGRMLVEPRIVRFPDDVLAWRDERDGYKALAERRGEALVALSRRVHHKEEHPWPFEDCVRVDCSEARAALELTNR